MSDLTPTPRPWTRHETDCCGVIWRINPNDAVADVFGGPNRAADAALIVEAVNAYDRLRAVEKAARWLVNIHFGSVSIDPDSALAEDIRALREALGV